jgi:hypothetical protein
MEGFATRGFSKTLQLTFDPRANAATPVSLEFTLTAALTDAFIAQV